MFDIGKLRDESTVEEFHRGFQRSGVLAGAADAGSWDSFRDRLISAVHETLGIAASQGRQSSLPPEFADLVNRRRGERLNRDRTLYRLLVIVFSNIMLLCFTDCIDARVGALY